MLIVNLTIDVTLLFIGRERKNKKTAVEKDRTAVYNKTRLILPEDSSPTLL